ncbi:hypothetical protein AKJ51_05215, partial [candidate division MSBL1 archaeon SCGC-AAA382A20]
PETLPLESIHNPIHVLTTPTVPKKKRNKQKQSNTTPSPEQTLLVKPSNLKLPNSEKKLHNHSYHQSKETRFGWGYKFLLSKILKIFGFQTSRVFRKAKSDLFLV